MIQWQLTALDQNPVAVGMLAYGPSAKPIPALPIPPPGQWSAQWDPSINPVPPAAFVINQYAGAGLELFCAGPPYAGALAKLVSPLVWPSPRLELSYLLQFDESAVACGQVVETDCKLTDAAGWTYDGSFQFNIAAGNAVGWLVQVGNPWQDTAVRAALQPGQPNPVTVSYQLDYVAHSLRVLGVMIGQGAMQVIALPAVPARQLGWQPSQVVTQLQLCTGKRGGAYRVRFGEVGYAAKG